MSPVQRPRPGLSVQVCGVLAVLAVLPPHGARGEGELGEGRAPTQNILQPQLGLRLGPLVSLVQGPHDAPLVVQPAGLQPLQQLEEVLGVRPGDLDSGHSPVAGLLQREVLVLVLLTVNMVIFYYFL